jgi:hypothetical protein
MSEARISIFLTRYSGDDDKITITSIGEDFKILYVDGICKTSHFVYSTESEVMAYVEDLFKLLADDADPFRAIQFSFPCFPSVLYKIPDFSANRAAIRDRLISTLRNWPERRHQRVNELLETLRHLTSNMPDLDFPINTDRTEMRGDAI